MIKIFWGAGVVTPSKSPPPYEQLLPLPNPCFKTFMERSLNDPPPPTTPLQASFTATPSPSTTPSPPKNFDRTHKPYTESEFLKICEDFRVPNDPVRYRDEKFYWTYQHGVHWPDDYIGPDSMTQWIIEGSVGFTDAGLYKISESVRAYAYLILSSQASARSSIIANMAGALTAQSAFLNNFENIVNHRVDFREDIKRYQDTLSYTSSKVDYSVGEIFICFLVT